MPTRIWLHEVTGNEFGWNVWCLDLLGFSTWAATESAVLARVPVKLEEHRSWLARHSVPAPPPTPDIEVAERVRGNEVLFARDEEPCSVAEVDLTIRLLSASREDLLATVSALPEGALDWNPPYRFFAPWATWRTVRGILAHIANTETCYYLPSVGYDRGVAAAWPDGDWRDFLARHRVETIGFLDEVRGARDRARVSRNEEQWSLRKVLGRLVRHELLHWKSIQRIAGEYAQTHAGGARGR